VAPGKQQLLGMTSVVANSSSSPVALQQQQHAVCCFAGHQLLADQICSWWLREGGWVGAGGLRGWGE
jgi:hypothetical protein